MKIRVGFGFDVHQLKEGRDFWLGGIKLEHHKGALGHSDADVLIHAICDAMLGALGLGDIGEHFPDTSGEFKNIDSKILLARTLVLIEKEGYRIGNIDSSVILEKPKIRLRVSEMKETLSKIVKISNSDISIKATTNEKMGYVGREEGICAYAVVLLEKD
jgi:2-C-methyl-D-erythritol 2,4-cyclodiphosphate synthase